MDVHAPAPVMPAQQSQNTPWSIIAVLIAGLISLGAVYVIIWKNLQRMGKPIDAKRFLIFGGLIIIVTIIATSFIGAMDSTFISVIPSGVGLGFLAWFYSGHYKSWQKQSLVKPGFDLQLLLWGAIGAILFYIVVYGIGTILTLFFPVVG